MTSTRQQRAAEPKVELAADGADGDGGGGLADTATELGALLPPPEQLTLASGTVVRLRPLKTLEMLMLMDIITSGIGSRLGELHLDPDEPDRVFAARFGALLLSALPGKGPQMVAFLRAMVEPDGKVTAGRVDKATGARNDELDAALDAELANPDPVDTITLVDAIARREAPQLQALGKHLARLWANAARTGLIPASLQSRG